MNMISESNEQKKFDELASLFKHLSHPVRLQILAELRFEEACVCHLSAVTGQRQAYLSQQLAILRSAGLIEDRKDGWNVFYRLKDARVSTLLDDLACQAATSLELSRTYPPNCSCPKCRAIREQQKEIEP